MTVPAFRFLNKQSIVLACFAVTVGTLLGLFNWFTAPQIKINQRAILIDSLNEVLPQQLYDNELANSSIVIYDPVDQQNKTIYTAYRNNLAAAAVIETTTPDGYAGEIKLLVGIQLDGTITGVRIVQHRETPGLGDDIELRKSNWILDFNGKSLQVPQTWAVKRDGGSFDQFTGATITPRAVVREVKQALVFFQQHQTEIFQTPHD